MFRPEIDETLMQFEGLCDYTKPKRYAVLYRKEFGGLHSVNQEVDLANYTRLGLVAACSLEDAYCALQGDNWSPNGEARNLIRKAGTDHTSMSVGDILFDIDMLTSHFCDPCGWRQIDPAGKVTVIENLTS